MNPKASACQRGPSEKWGRRVDRSKGQLSCDHRRPL